jgi:hypothetical protein
MIGQLIADIEAFAASLRRSHAINVNDQSSKEHAIALATRYFREMRPLVVEVTGETDELRDNDELWQQLVRLAHGNNARRTYLNTILRLRRQLRQFSIATLAAAPSTQRVAQSGGPAAFSREETLVLETLQSLVPSAAASYRQGLSDLLSPDRLSFRGTATEFRESLRETLDHLAPDADVEAQDWYKPEHGQTKPTMKQRTAFILISRERDKTQRGSAEKMVGLIEELSGEVMRAVYNRASLATHVNQSKKEVQRIKRYVDTMFFDLLEITQ